MEWIGRMGNIQACAREIINNELITHNISEGRRYFQRYLRPFACTYICNAFRCQNPLRHKAFEAFLFEW